MKQTTGRTLDTLIDDVYTRLQTPAEVDQNNLDILLKNIGALLADRLSAEERKPYLRMSSIGKCERQVFLDLTSEEKGEELQPHTLIKFLYGDIIEELLLFLIREAGHNVEEQQKEVELEGVKGHIDAIIDGEVCDVKSASKFGFKKFKEGTLANDDPFGYEKQLAGYSKALGGIPGAFVAMNKESGELALLRRDVDHLEMEHPDAKIRKHKQNLIDNTLPKRPYTAVPEGKSGNMKLGVNCSYCARKEECWSDANNGKGLRKFIYSYGPVYLTEVEREPKVPESK